MAVKHLEVAILCHFAVQNDIILFIILLSKALCMTFERYFSVDFEYQSNATIAASED